ncbi:MAG: HlyD family efflux transporter periplasmic adaptor subunit [Clostridiales bacterium]|nr:HlyD family efflux transporter periplasmic adaptor subunit [Clostridiales bacterium]
MNKKQIIPIIIIAITGTLLISYGQKNTLSGDIYYGEAVGSTYKISAKTSGLLETLNVSEGDSVEIDQTVAIIDNQDLDYQVAEAQKQLALASAQLKKGTSSVRPEELQIYQNAIKSLTVNLEILTNTLIEKKSAYQEATLAANLANMMLDQKILDYNNAKVLFEAGSISQNDLNNSELAYHTALENRDASDLALSRLETEVETSEKQRNLVKIDLDNAEQQLNMVSTGFDSNDIEIATLTLESAQLSVDRTKNMADGQFVVSKQNGIVETVNYEIGEFIPSGTSVMTLYNPSELKVKIYINESDLATIKLGQTLAVTDANNPDMVPIDATIIHIANQAMFTPLNIVTVKDRERLVFEVELSLDRSDSLHPGMLLKVVVEEVEN